MSCTRVIFHIALSSGRTSEQYSDNKLVIVSGGHSDLLNMVRQPKVGVLIPREVDNAATKAMINGGHCLGGELQGLERAILLRFACVRACMCVYVYQMMM